MRRRLCPLAVLTFSALLCGAPTAHGDDHRPQPVDGKIAWVYSIWEARTRQSGLKVGDIVVVLDGLRRDMTIRQIHAHLILNRNYGEGIPLVVDRGGKEQTLTLDLAPAPPKLE